MRCGLQILVDIGESMTPFREDQRQLVRHLHDLVGDEFFEVFQFRGTPEREAQPVTTQREIESYTPPPPGTPVLALTDLSIGALSAGSLYVPPSEWLAFARRLQGEGCPPVAYVPYGRDRWPVSLRGIMKIIHWHHGGEQPIESTPKMPQVRGSEDVKDLVRRLYRCNPHAVALGSLVSLANRVDLSLLRRMRKTLAPYADGGAEADLWFSSMVQVRGATAILLRSDVAESLRKALRKEAPEMFERAWSELSDYRKDAHAFEGTLLQEKINYLEARDGAAAKKEIQRLLRGFVRTLVEQECDEDGLAPWSLEVLDSVSQEVRAWDASRELSLAAGMRLDLPGVALDTIPDDLSDKRWLLPVRVSDLPVTRIGVRLTPEGLVFREPPETDAEIIDYVPKTLPRILWLRWGNEQTQRRPVSITPGHPTMPIPMSDLGDGPILMALLNGAQWRLQLRSRPIGPAGLLRVYICCVGEDVKAAASLYNDLKACEIKPWLLEEEKNLPIGYSAFNERERTHAVLVYVSPNALQADGHLETALQEIVQEVQERNSKRERTVPIVPVLTYDHALPDELRNWQPVHLDMPGELVRFVEQLAKLAGQVGASLPKPIPMPPSLLRRELPSPLVIASPLHLECVLVPACVHWMGSRQGVGRNEERPCSTVPLSDFYIGKYPVTVDQFRVFVEATGYKTTAEQQGYGFDWVSLNPDSTEHNAWVKVLGASWHHPYGPEKPPSQGNHPVTQASWRDAMAFCRWLSEASGRQVTLPTEAQWDRAARGPDIRTYPWGDNPPNTDLCNYDKNVDGTTPVGRYGPKGDSVCGCSDMAGNVWEWTSSLYWAYPYDSADGREDINRQGYHTARGGSYHGNAEAIRASVRDADEPAMLTAAGFRVAVAPGLAARRALDFSDYIDQVTKGFTGREGAFAEINKWLDTPSGPVFFLITGSPGSGKSALAARLTKIPNVVAYHFCLAGRSETTDARTFVASVIIQLMRSLPGFGPALLQGDGSIIEISQAVGTIEAGGEVVGLQIETLDLGAPLPRLHISQSVGKMAPGAKLQSVQVDSVSLPDAPLKETFHKFVIMPLVQATFSASTLPVVIVVDGLDAASSGQEGESILDLLAGSEAPSQLRFVLTSRPDARVLGRLAQDSVARLDLDSHESENLADIRAYLDRAAQDPAVKDALSRADARPGDVVDRVTTASQGNFQYARLALGQFVAGRLKLTDKWRSQSEFAWLARLSSVASNAWAWAEGWCETLHADAVYSEYLLTGLYQFDDNLTHLLLILFQDDSAMRSSLTKLSNNMPRTSLTLDAVGSRVLESLSGPSLSPNLRDALAEAAKLADSESAEEINARHLLAGLLATSENMAGKFIAQTLGGDRQALHQLLSGELEDALLLDAVRELHLKHRMAALARIKILEGDLLAQQADAIVHSTSSDLGFEGSIGEQLRRRLGDKLVNKVRSQGRPTLGEALVTDAGTLDAHHVIHAPTREAHRRSTPETVARGAAAAMAAAATLEDVQTVAFGAMGVTARLDQSQVAPLVLEAVADYLEQHERPAHVLFVLSDRHHYEIYASTYSALRGKGGALSA